MGGTYILRKGVSNVSDLADGGMMALNALKGPAGKIFYVDYKHENTSDYNEGLDPNKPLTTIAKAYDKCTDEKMDVIYVGGRGRYRETELSILKGGVRIVGAGWGVEWNQTASASAYVVKVMAENVIIKNIQISVNDQGGGIYVGDGGSTYNGFCFLVENCFIRGDWYNEATRIPGASIGHGIYNYGATLMTVRNNLIWGWGTGVHVQGGSSRTSYGARIMDNHITYCRDHAIHFEGAGYTSCITGNYIWDTASDIQATALVDLHPSTGGILVAGNYIAGGTPAYDLGDLNYWTGNFVEDAEATSELNTVAREAF